MPSTVKSSFFINSNVVSNSVTIERKHKQIKKKTVGVGEEKTDVMGARNEGNSFHFGANFEKPLGDEAASSQELGEEDLNSIVKESNFLDNVL